MATRSVFSHVLRLAGIALLAGILVSGSVLLPAAPIQAASSVPASAGAPASPTDDGGIIAYADRTYGDIHLIRPDGTGDHVLWTQPRKEKQWLEIDLQWRPDGRELAFTSVHENGCSWYDSDIFAVASNGSGYRRITNSPACAELAKMPQGAVTVSVNNYTSTPIWVYVAGAPSVKMISGSGTVLFEQVADFGPGIYQPCIGIGGLPRFVCYPPYADVIPGQTVAGGIITIMQYSGFRDFGAGKISWKAGGSALAYNMRAGTEISQISARPSYGDNGVKLPVNSHTKPSLVAWGPTAATANQYLYVSPGNLLDEGYHGIWLGSVDDASGGTQLANWDDYGGPTVYDIEWLPDGSGFLTSVFYVGLGFFVDIFRYDFATHKFTQLTDLPADVDLAYELSISPNGQQVAFEREKDDVNSDSSVWIMNIDGSDLHKLVDHAGKPAWGRIPAVPDKPTFLPVIMH